MTFFDTSRFSQQRVEASGCFYLHLLLLTSSLWVLFPQKVTYHRASQKPPTHPFSAFCPWSQLLDSSFRRKSLFFKFKNVYVPSSNLMTVHNSIAKVFELLTDTENTDLKYSRLCLQQCRAWICISRHTAALGRQVPGRLVTLGEADLSVSALHPWPFHILSS